MGLLPIQLRKETSNGEAQEYPRSFFLNTKEVHGFLSHTIKDWAISFLPRANVRLEDRQRITEAYFVSYFCHEIRHDLQFERFVTEDGTRFQDGSEKHLLGMEEWISEQPVNSWIPTDTFRSVLVRWCQEQRQRYISYLGKCYDDYSFALAIEGDALYVQVLAFDCWLSNMPRDQKLLRIEEIVRTFRESQEG